MHEATVAPAAGPVERAITRKLAVAFEAAGIEVINESRMHNVPPGSESHFKVVVVTSRFSGLGLVDRHRKVHAALAEELAAGLHALSIVAHTPEEWEARGRVVPPTPACHGGSKHG